MFQKLSYYPGQPKEETTQLVIFQSIFAIVPFLFAEVIVAIVALVLIYFGSAGRIIAQISIGSHIFLLAGFVIMALNFLFFFATMWVWRHNRMLVTNEHVVDVDQIGLFSSKVATLSLGVIQDVSSTITGPTQTIFGYGTVVIQTAGERENFVFAYVPNPREVEQKILEVHEKFIHHNNRYQSEVGSPTNKKSSNRTSNPHNPLEDA